MATVHWREMATFTGVDLGDSFVLSWTLTTSAFVIEREISLWPGHPAYEPPRPDEYTCYKRGQLIFPNARNVLGLRKPSEAQATYDPDGSIDSGNIDALAEESPGHFIVHGEFGNVHVESDRPQLIVPEPA